MSQKIARKIKGSFERLTGCGVDVAYMPPPHKPTALRDGECGVYVFLVDGCSFKVGKASADSKPRWNSHHYNLDNKTPSTLPKSICKNITKFRGCFPQDAHTQINNAFLEERKPKTWIMNNLARIEFKMKASDNQGGFALTLLEALVQFELKPMLEGKNS